MAFRIKSLKDLPATLPAALFRKLRDEIEQFPQKPATGIYKMRDNQEAARLFKQREALIEIRNCLKEERQSDEVKETLQHVRSAILAIDKRLNLLG